MRRYAADPSTILGVSLAFLLVGGAIHLGGNPKGFIDHKAILIVIFGTFAVTVACYSLPEVLRAHRVVLYSLFYCSEDLTQTAIRSLEVAEIARKRGFLELEKYRSLTKHNAFFRDGIDMIVDNITYEEIEQLLSHEVDAMAERNSKATLVLNKLAETAPAMGLIGTLIGLVQMLGRLEDPSTIGPAMAVALLTTFYGAVLSYMVFSPLATKIERNTKADLMVAGIYLLAVKSIAKKENPRQLELMINSTLPPAKRVQYFEQKRQQNPQEGGDQGQGAAPAAQPAPSTQQPPQSESDGSR